MSRWLWSQCGKKSPGRAITSTVKSSPPILRGDQRGGLHVNWKNTKTRVSLTLLSQLFLKYAYTVGVFIHRYVQTKFLMAFCRFSQTFEKPFCQWTWFKFPAIKWFFKSVEESASENVVRTYWWMKTSTVYAYFKNSCESSGREILVFVFFLNLIQVHQKLYYCRGCR